MKQRITIAVLALVATLASTSLWIGNVAVSAAKVSGSNGPTMVVMTASWCGTCRELAPVLERVAAGSAGNGVHLVSLDVDDKAAPNTANGFGITVEGNDVPQVYLVNNGKTTLLFNGKEYRFGQSSQAEALIRERLQSNL